MRSIPKGLKDSDLDKFFNLYRSVEVTPTITKNDMYNHVEPEAEYALSLGEDKTDKIGEYTGFFTIILFNKQGKFLSQHFWE